MNDRDTAREFLRQLGAPTTTSDPVLTLGTIAVGLQSAIEMTLAPSPLSPPTDLHSTSLAGGGASSSQGQACMGVESSSPKPAASGLGPPPSQRGTRPAGEPGSDSITHPPRCDSSTCWDEDDGLSPAHRERADIWLRVMWWGFMVVGFFAAVGLSWAIKNLIFG